MALQDIKYVMSVDDGQAKRAIAKTVSDLSTLDKTKFGGNDAERFAQTVGNIGHAASQTLSTLGAEIGGIFGGSFLGNALGDSIGETMAGAVTASTGVVASSFGSAGMVAGFSLGAAYLKESRNYFLESALGLQEIMVKTLATLNLGRFLPKINTGVITGPLSSGYKKVLDVLASSTQPIQNFAAKQIGALAMFVPRMFDDYVMTPVGKVFKKLDPIKLFGKDFSDKFATPIKNAFSKGFAGIGTIAASAMTLAAGVVTAGAIVIGGAFAGIAMYANSVWSEVEDGVMKAQAAMVSLGASVDEAFSDEVTNKILQVTETLAYGLGSAPKDVAEATAHLMKNGMDLDQALSRMSLAQNIATVNGITMAAAAEKIVSAWSGEVRVLKDIGIRMKSTGDISEDAALAMEKLIARYGDPALSKPFIDDSPMTAASAAITDLWAKLGQALDPSITAAWGSLADIILGIAVSLRDSGSSDFIPNVEGVLAAIGATVRVVVNAAVVVSNVIQMLFTGLKMVGQTVWYGLQFGWAWIKSSVAELVTIIGDAVSLIPGTGDAGENLKKTAEGLKENAAGAMDAAGKALGDAAMKNFEALKVDAADIGNALSANGGAVGDLARKGREERERRQKEAEEMARNPKALGENERVREERERKEREAAEKRAKKQKQTFEQNRRIESERGRYAQNRTTVVVQTPQRMNVALRYSR